MAKFNRQRFNNRKNTTRMVTKQQVRSMIESIQEKKVLNVISGGTTTTAGSFAYISAISQSVDVSGRIGNRIKISDVKIDIGMIDAGSSLTRFLLISDSMNLGATPAVTDVISSANYYSHISTASTQQNRFRILLDEIIATSAGAAASLHLERRIRKSIVVNYNSTTNGIASAGKGAILLLVLGNGVTANYDFSAQIRFADD